MTLTFADPAPLTHEQLEEGTAFAPRFDGAGLVTVVTTEAGTNEVLMLAHMNAEALSLTLQTGIAHYWSRELRTDCDQDAIVLVVNQTGRGAACHTGRKSCFYRKAVVDEAGVLLEDRGLPRLFDPKDVY